MNSSSPSLISTRVPGGFELCFHLFDKPYQVFLERIRPGHYMVMLDGDIIGQIDRPIPHSWTTPIGVTTRSYDVAAYTMTLWYLLGKEWNEL